MSYLMRSDPPLFSMDRQGSYILERKTPLHNVRYFVTKSFAQQAPNANTVRSVEEAVERTYVRELQNQCYYQRLTHQRELASAKRQGKEVFEKLSREKLPSCEALHAFG